MSQATTASQRGRRPPPSTTVGVLGWIRGNLFSNFCNTALTLLVAWALFVTLPGLVRWAFIDSLWYTNDPQACREITGACWAVIAEKYRVMLFGTWCHSNPIQQLNPNSFPNRKLFQVQLQNYWKYKYRKIHHFQHNHL